MRSFLIHKKRSIGNIFFNSARSPISVSKAVFNRSYWNLSSTDDDSYILGEGNNRNSSENSIIAQGGDNSPTVNPIIILPTRIRPIFPGFMATVMIRNEETIEALIKNEKAGGYVGIFYRPKSIIDNTVTAVAKDDLDLITDINQLSRVGTFAQIQKGYRSGTSGSNPTTFVLMGHRRITLDSIGDYGPPAIGNVTHWNKQTVVTQSATLKAHIHEVLASLRELIALNPLLGEQFRPLVENTNWNDPYKLADFASAITTADGADLQKVLEATNVEERLAIALELLAQDREMTRVQQQISKQVEEKVSKQQREYFLREQMKNIKKELGMEKDDKEELLPTFQAKLAEFTERNVAKETLKLIGDEMKKLESLEKTSSEFAITRSYLEWLVAIPWGSYTEDVLNIPAARAALDADHYGMEDVKSRILEFIAVGKLRGTVAGKIVCLVGPPGVGKTSIAKSIAHALNKKFYRFSVGGLSDTAEIKGHRRTYVGAMPGKPIQSLKYATCFNPVILIDEIDKVGRRDYGGGDPTSALLELLDPNQNSTFVDHYLDHPVDFSRVLFICTANDESTIPGPLLDRMEIIRLSGYDLQEKVAIAQKYLVPKVFSDSGLSTPSQISSLVLQCGIDDAALQQLVKNYSRESGVRSLEKLLEKIARKIAFQIATEMDQNESLAATSAATPSPTPSPVASEAAPAAIDQTVAPILEKKIQVTTQNLESFVGKPIFQQDSIYSLDTNDGSGVDEHKEVVEDAEGVAKKSKHLPVGVVMGLAWNPFGGSTIFIETASIPVSFSERGSDSVNVITGQLGSVMKESVNIAYTYAKQFVASIDKESKFFNSHQLHLHVPEGAVSKDGPSAGVAMTTSLISIATGKPVKPLVAMTGEISLTGKVLPVGGIKEKTLAAKRAGATTILLPLMNKRDFDELPDYVKEGLKVHFLSEYRQVYDLLFVDNLSP